MPASKANQRAVNKYKKNNYDRIEITVPKGQRDVFQAHAAARGQSVNGFIVSAIDEKMQRDAGAAPEGPQQAAGTPGSGGGVPVASPQNAPHEAAAAALSAGAVSLPPETLQAAQDAAEAAGEAIQDFVGRAVKEQAHRDKLARKLQDNMARSAAK